MFIFIYILVGLVSLPILFVLGYLLAAYLLKRIAVNTRKRHENQDVEIYVFSNGAHTDICFPVKTIHQDWRKFIPTDKFEQTGFEYIAFGWGDKGFYFDTPTWAELKLSTGLKAVFSLSESTMHVVYHPDKQFEDNKFYHSLVVSPAQYRILVDYIKKSFDYDQNGDIIHIPFAGLPAYSHMNDQFYEARGRYHFFKTCNCWVNTGLKKAGIKTAVWTPFADAVFHHLPVEKNKKIVSIAK